MDEADIRMQSTSRLRSVNEVENLVEEWLDDEGFKLWKVPDEDSEFSYKVSRGDIHPLVVHQPGTKTDSIRVVGEIKLDKKNHEKLLTIPEKEKGFMLFDLRMGLLSKDCRWEFLPSLESWKTLRIFKTAFSDGFSKDRFFEILEAVDRAVTLVCLSLEWKFDIKSYTS